MAEYGGCRACRHLFYRVYSSVDGMPTCRAFPEGIPLIIFVGNIQHTKPLPDQDNTIVYEPAEKPFWLRDPILDFYLGQQPNSQGRAIEEIWSWDYQKLEAIHDYIQWLFPLTEKSYVNTSAPTLNDRAIQAFRTSDELRNRLIQSLKVMLAFYGLECRTEENAEIVIAKSEEYLSRSRKWIERLNHNYLRLTRILTSLTILGLENYALALFNCLDELYNENKEVIGLTTYNYWKNAVNS